MGNKKIQSMVIEESCIIGVKVKKRIVVKGPALSCSGYGEQARFALRSLRELEDQFDLFYFDIPWGRTGRAKLLKEESAWIDSLMQKTINHAKQNNNKVHFDISVQVTIPNEFEKMADVNIGYTAGIETTKVSPKWIEKCNMMDKIVVPSNHSKQVFENTQYRAKNSDTGEEFDFKLNTPVEVCSFPALDKDSQELKLDLETDFNFLSVAQWGPRKNVVATLRNFIAEFKNDENVGLVLKMNTAKNSTMDREVTEQRLKSTLDSIVKERGEHKCKIYLLHGNMTDEEMRGLYRDPSIKAFVTTTHGEGFGLPMLEAALAELPIVAPSWSAYTDFLFAPKKDKKTGKTKNRAHFTKIDFELKPVQKEAVWDGVIQEDSQWCWVKDHSTRDAMREVVKNYTLALSNAKKLKPHILESISEEKQLELMSFLLTGEKQVKIALEEIPKVSVVTSLFKSDEHIEGFLEDMVAQTIFKEKCELLLTVVNASEKEKQVISSYVEKYPENIKPKYLTEDPGIYGCWNLGIKRSTGEFITNANADDRRSPRFLEELAKSLVVDDDIGVVYADNLLTHNPNESWNSNTATQTYPSEEFSLDAMLRGNPPHCMPMWRKTLHEEHGYFSEEYRSASDWEFWLRCAFAGIQMKKVNKPLGLYYFNPKGMSTNQEHNEWKRKEEKDIFLKYKKIKEESKRKEIVL